MFDFWIKIDSVSQCALSCVTIHTTVYCFCHYIEQRKGPFFSVTIPLVNVKLVGKVILPGGFPQVSLSSLAFRFPPAGLSLLAEKPRRLKSSQQSIKQSLIDILSIKVHFTSLQIGLVKGQSMPCKTLANTPTLFQPMPRKMPQKARICSRIFRISSFQK